MADKVEMSREVMVAVLDEKMKHLSEKMDEHETVQRENVKATNLKIDKLTKEFESYVSQREFTPIKLIVYGMAGIIMTSVLVAILTKVIV